MAKSITKKTSKGTKATRTRKPKRSWSIYIQRALKQVNKDLSLSSKSMKVVNSYCTDLFERIAAEAAVLVRANKKKTLGSAEIQTAVRLILPAELAKHAMAEGTKAVKASA